MAYKPMLFNTEMVRAIMDGRKTQTRRVIKNPPENAYPGKCVGGAGLFDIDTNMRVVDAPFNPGDILWVRETWHKDVGRYMYKASYADSEKFYRNGEEVRIKWKPSIHMPKEAARIFLMVKNVRTERLQDIMMLDAINEGCSGTICDHANANPWRGCTDCYNTGWLEPPDAEFAILWDSTIKPADLPKYGWDANPWVWVIEFERCEKPKG